MLKASFIIPFYNDGESAIITAKLAKANTSLALEFIFIDDGSTETYNEEEIRGLGILIKNTRNSGVGFSFDRGVEKASHELLFLSGADIRFKAGEDFGMGLVDYLDDKSIIASSCVSLTPDMQDPRLGGTVRSGADLKFFIDNKDVPNKPENYRDIISAKWFGIKELTRTKKNIHEVPCILGAFYLTTKSWYNHIRGFEGHQMWGCLEPYISIKTWLSGGTCKVATNIKTGHIFARNPHRNTAIHYPLYNKLLTALTCLPTNIARRLIEHLGDNPILEEAKSLIYYNQDQIIELYKYYQEEIFNQPFEKVFRY